MRWGQPHAQRHPMDYTYRFEDHLREHWPSRLGQRLWWMPASAGVGVVIAEGVYLAATPPVSCRTRSLSRCRSLRRCWSSLPGRR